MCRLYSYGLLVYGLVVLYEFFVVFAGVLAVLSGEGMTMYCDIVLCLC